MAVRELFTLHLVDGLPTTVDGKEVAYKKVTLRETTVGDEIKAHRLAQDLVVHEGRPIFADNEQIFTIAMTMLACELFECDGHEPIDQVVMNLDLFGKLSKSDLAKIEERSALIELSAQVRHGVISEDDMKQMIEKAMEKEPTKQPSGQSQTVAKNDVESGLVCEPVIDRLAQDAQGGSFEPVQNLE